MLRTKALDDVLERRYSLQTFFNEQIRFHQWMFPEKNGQIPVLKPVNFRLVCDCGRRYFPDVFPNMQTNAPPTLTVGLSSLLSYRIQRDGSAIAVPVFKVDKANLDFHYADTPVRAVLLYGNTGCLCKFSGRIPVTMSSSVISSQFRNRPDSKVLSGHLPELLSMICRMPKRVPWSEWSVLLSLRAK